MGVKDTSKVPLITRHWINQITWACTYLFVQGGSGKVWRSSMSHDTNSLEVGCGEGPIMLCSVAKLSTRHRAGWCIFLNSPGCFYGESVEAA